jgi:anti-sigma factor RsiW
MNDYEVLMMEALDGTITPAAQTQLNTYLAAHPELRAMFDAMCDVDATLTAAPSVAASPAFAHSVMHTVRTMKIARPLKAQHVAMLTGLNAISGILIWGAGLFVLGTVFRLYAPTALKQGLWALAHAIASVLNVLAKASQTLLTQPITWIALALCALIVVSWVGVLSRLMRPAHQTTMRNSL